MKALSLTQPWATALILGQKKVETRSWRPPGSLALPQRIAVHAAKGFPCYAREFAENERALGRIPEKLPLGAIIGFVTLTGFESTGLLYGRITPLERLYGDYSPGRWGWTTERPMVLNAPIPCRGALGLWEVPKDLLLDVPTEFG